MVDMRFHATGCVSRAAVICLLLLAVTPVRAQDFPVKPIRVFVPFATGNPLDNMLRVVSEGLQRSLGQPLVVDNRPGAGGIVAAQALLASPAEGYSLLLATAAILTVNPHSYKNLARPETTTCCAISVCKLPAGRALNSRKRSHASVSAGGAS